METMWKLAENYPCLEVSSTGLARNSITKHIYTCAIDRYGYYKLNITYNQIQIYAYLHRVICEVFYGHSDMTVDHINGNKADNRPSNLRWLSAFQNLSRATKGVKKSSIMRARNSSVHSGTNAWQCNFCDSQIKDIRRKLLFGISQANIAREYHVSPQVIGDISRGRTYK